MKQLLAATLLASAAFAAPPTPDWPQFRGPAANPIAENPALPDRWSRTGHIAWSADLPGRGWSSPIVTGNRVFLTTAVTDGASKKPQLGVDFSNDYVAELSKQGLSQAEILAKVQERDIEQPHEVTLHYFLYCLDLRSGRPLWRREYHTGRPPMGRHRKNSFTSETPITDGRHIYVYTAGLGLYAFDLNGKLHWKTPLEPQPIYLDFGTGASAALHQNTLIIVFDNETQGFVAAFDKRTGKQLWHTARDLKEESGPKRRSGWATPYIWTNAARTEIITNGPSTVVSYDLEGRELWRLRGLSGTPIAMPFAANGLLYINGGPGKRLYAVKEGASGDITPPDGRDTGPHIAWSAERAGTYLPTQVIYQGGVYVLNEKGIFARYDAATGKLTYKSRLDPDAGAFTSSPWAYNGRIFCLSEEGKTYVVKAGDKFELLATNDLADMAQATPAIVGNRLLLRTETKLWAIEKP